MFTRKIAEVIGDGRGMFLAQVAENGEYRCWYLNCEDVSRFRLREHNEIVIECGPGDRFCRVVQVGFPEA